MPRDLFLGSTGKDVVALQRLVKHHLSPPRIPLAADGIFGPKTRARVIEFQTHNRLWPLIMPPASDIDGFKRGGSWLHGAIAFRTTVRSGFPPDRRNNNIGLRCVQAP